MSVKKLTWKKILKVTACVLIFCFLGLFVFVKYWAGPKFARTRFERVVSTFWDGPLRIEEVQFSVFGQAYFKGVAFLDNESREWAYAATISATVGNWPSRSVYLSAVEIDNLAVKLHTYVNKEAFPLKVPSRKSAKRKSHGHLLTLIVNGGFVEAIDLNRGRIGLGHLTVSANRKADHFEIVSSLAKSDTLKDIVAKGTLDTTNAEVDMSLTVDRDLTVGELTPLISLLNQSTVLEVAGRLTADIGLKGSISEPRSVLVRGDMRFDNGSVSVDGETEVADVSAVLAIDGPELHFSELTGTFCGGTIQGTAHIDDYRSESMGIKGELRADDIDLAYFADKHNYQDRITRGKATLEYSFAAENTNPSTLAGKGSLAVDDADILPMPLLTKISKSIGLTDKEMQATSDVFAAFTTDGFVVELDQAYLTNQHAAIVVESGGIMDVRRQTCDMYINAIHLKFVGDFMRRLPVVKLFIGLSDKLTRLHVKGQWSDPASELIRKEPVKDVKDGVVDFFLDAARSGGQLTDSILDTRLHLLNGSEKRD